SWDMRYQPVGDGGGGRGGGGGAAVPHRTYSSVNAPWAAPGTYTVRLTANGKSVTQPLTVKLDPRVKTAALALTQLNTLTKEMYDGARSAHAAYEQARALLSELDSAQGDDVAPLKEALNAIAPPPAAGGGRGFGAGPGGGAPGGGGRGGRGGRGGGAETATLD